MTKILHTADWHIGKVLYRQDLTAEMLRYFDWLIDYIQEQKIDILLISGDVFDLANPSNRDESMYYKMLRRLMSTGVKTIITGGNHDSISLLDKPMPLLEQMNIHVVGGARENIEEEIIPCYDAEGRLLCVVLAVPFLRDKDIRRSLPADEQVDKLTATQDGIANHYQSLAEIAVAKYGKDIALIAMGHLFMRDAMTSDSERTIHVGQLLGLDSQWIGDDIDYFALGHIHKPQRIQGMDHVRYSGSPIFLDFSEIQYEKQMILLTIDDDKVEGIEPIKIPTFRKLVRLNGTFAEIMQEINALPRNVGLPTFVEIIVNNPDMELDLVRNVDEYIINQEDTHFKIIKSQITTGENLLSMSLSQENRSIDELSDTEVFDKCMDAHQVDEDIKPSLTQCYHQILEMLND